MEKLYFNKTDIAQILGVTERTASTRIKTMNEELEAQGYYAESGKVPKELFFEKYPYYKEVVR